jgi:tetratricopeptide (TPR) repeat protein
MTPTDLKSTLQTALAHHQAGRIAEAERLYRGILAVVPEHPEAMHHLGIVAMQCGKPQVALQLIGRAVELHPSAAALNNLGEALRTLGRVTEAVDCYRKAIAIDDRQSNALANLGLALTTLKQWPEAETSLRKCLSLVPNHLAALVGLANVLTLLSRFDDAVAALESAARLSPNDASIQRSLASAWLEAGDPYRAAGACKRAIELQPSDPQAHGTLSRALEKVDKTDEAIAAARRATELGPALWQAYQNLAGLLERSGKSAEAADALKRAVALNPREPTLYAAMSSALCKEGLFEEATTAANKAIALDPSDLRLWSQLWVVRSAAADFQTALEAARKSVALDPHNVDAHAHLSFSLLALGQFEEGFKEYEWRWRDPNATTKPRDFDQPLWDGSDPAGRTILVHTEQGFGDVFQFLRYVPLIQARGAKVLVEANYKVAGLVRRMAANVTLCIAGTMLPHFDLHVPLASLPTLLGTTSRTIPATIPYLSADRALAAQWRARLEPTDGLLVGLVWAGSAKPDPRRSATLADFAPLGAVPGVTLISLQPRPEADDANNPPAGMKLKNLGAELRDFADTTASVLANLDLLITVDTGVAHLASAMGIPTWILLREAPEWRWTLDEKSSPWYPTVRLFRQPTCGDWTSVVEHVAEELRSLAGPKLQ